MNALSKERLVNGMLHLVDAVRGGSKGNLILKTGEALAVLQQFTLNDENFTDEEREVIFAHAKRLTEPDDTIPATER